jgi:hypothetical protein
MICLSDCSARLALIKLKFPVPQVGSRIFPYESDAENIFFSNEDKVDFIVDEEGFLRLGRGHYKMNQKKDCLYMAGRLLIRNNKIVYIDNDSGHYEPPEQAFRAFLDYFRSLPYLDSQAEIVFLDY